MYRAPGYGRMGQPGTIQTGGLVSQMMALAGTALPWTQINFGMTTPVPARFIMCVNCKQTLL